MTCQPLRIFLQKKTSNDLWGGKKEQARLKKKRNENICKLMIFWPLDVIGRPACSNNPVPLPPVKKVQNNNNNNNNKLERKICDLERFFEETNKNYYMWVNEIVAWRRISLAANKILKKKCRRNHIEWGKRVKKRKKELRLQYKFVITVCAWFLCSEL